MFFISSPPIKTRIHTMNEKNLLESAAQYFLKGDFTQAISTYSQIIEESTDNAVKGKCNYQIGCGYFKMKKYRKSTYYLRQALYLFQTSEEKAKAYFRRGMSYQYLQEYAKACEDYDLAIALYSRDDLKAEAHHHKGEVYEELKEYRKAIEAYTCAQNLYSKSTDKEKSVASCNRSREKLDDRIPSIRSKTEHMKTMEVLELGQKAFHRGDYREAIAHQSKVIKTSKHKDLKIQAYRDRGNSYSKLEKHTEAIRDYKKVMRLSFQVKSGRFAVSLRKYLANALGALLKK